MAGGLLLVGGTALASLALILAGQVLRQSLQQPITPELSPAALWQRYRWSTDPAQRREAALLLSSSIQAPLTRQRLLTGQGWGTEPLASVALQQQAETSAQLGRQERSDALWRDLLHRFPGSAVSADARYHLSAGDQALQRELLRRQPTHPAALDAAVRDGQALHLAQWAPHHHGAEMLIRRACDPTASPAPSGAERQLLARGLAELGDGAAALDCLNSEGAQPATKLAIARALLGGDRLQQRKANQLLLALTQNTGAHKRDGQAISLEAAALLSTPLKPDPALLAAIPKPVRDRSADVATAEVRLGLRRDRAAVLKRWPQEPASWQLQWDLARDALLKGQWSEAEAWLALVSTASLPEPLAARQQFWLGLAIAKQERRTEADAIWQLLLRHHPRGYYTWRAASRLHGSEPPPLATPSSETPAASSWAPLNSGDREVDDLWRLGLSKPAWETWRSRHPQTESAPEGLVEGRLRLARGDSWNGLDRLWRTSLRLVSDDCPTRELLHQSQHPQPFQTVFLAAARDAGIHRELLLAIAKQESRFSPGVTSPVGAVGLMQLMPATAAELAGRPLSTKALQDPERNAQLGALYLARLLRQWQGNPWLVVASYNAGPGAAGSWTTRELAEDPELWVERIPYPETRLYTKKVLGNLWAYLKPGVQLCSTRG